MKTAVRNIGNSKGVILPKSFLKQCFIEENVIIEVKDNKIVIAPAHEQKRVGWADAFKKMAENGDDVLLISSVLEDDNINDWTWK